MHTMHLGWLQHFFGSVMAFLVFHILPEKDLENLVYIGKFIKEFQSSNRVKHRYRTRLDKLTMIQPKKGFPKVRGRAADIAGLGSSLLALWTKHMQNTDLQHRQIHLFLKLWLQVKDLLETFSPTFGHMAIPTAQYQELFKAALNMAQLHSQLNEHFESLGLKLFNQTSKMHFALHALQMSCWIHPHLTWCYKGESTMHRVQVLWKSCLHGSKHWQAAKKASHKERYLLLQQGRI